MKKRQRKKNVDKWQKLAQWEIDKMVRNGLTYIHFGRSLTRPPEDATPEEMKEWFSNPYKHAPIELLCKEMVAMCKAMKHAKPYKEFA